MLQLSKAGWQLSPLLPVNPHNSWLWRRWSRLGTTSSQAAVSTAARTISSRCSFLPRLGVTTKFVRSGSQHELVRGIEDAIDNKIRAVYVESIGNPRYDVADLETIAKVANRKGIPLIVSDEAPSVIALLFNSANAWIGGQHFRCWWILHSSHHPR